ncbi:phosphotransferase [Paracoccus sp. S-4012]|uniref:CehA/McbA family metallohydrolase n=1 Tax=Paracoccus sp. S-4012 TaxID=2665648 RepID=UPI0012AF744C|nr:CehA/McbA family metallohydrolase [Paracoccus sp. S-4012]MRX52106.1 phosphotransferase [Paracoccus sp. S-4012]
MLSAFTAPGRFWRGNIHGHSDASDGALAADEVCRRYKSAGYDFVAVTDHFFDKYGYPITDTQAARCAEFTTIIGAELHAPANGRGEIWHVLAVGLPIDFAPPSEGETGIAIARRAHKAGAFIAIPHPHWSQLTLADARELSFAHAIEVYNHTSQVNCDRGDGLVLYDDAATAGLRFAAIATDDSHFRADDGFGGWVMVKAEENTPEALLAALKAGHCYASQGPEIHDLRREGDELVVTTSPISAAMLVGPQAGSSRVHGEGLTETRLPLDLFLGRWCRLAIRDARGRRAWTSVLDLD